MVTTSSSLSCTAGSSGSRVRLNCRAPFRPFRLSLSVCPRSCSCVCTVPSREWCLLLLSACLKSPWAERSTGVLLLAGTCTPFAYTPTQRAGREVTRTQRERRVQGNGAGRAPGGSPGLWKAVCAGWVLPPPTRRQLQGRHPGHRALGPCLTLTDPRALCTPVSLLPKLSRSNQTVTVSPPQCESRENSPQSAHPQMHARWSGSWEARPQAPQKPGAPGFSGSLHEHSTHVNTFQEAQGDRGIKIKRAAH